MAKITPGCSDDPVYARRVGLLWGTHWHCEEAVKWGPEEDGCKKEKGHWEESCNVAVMPLLLICKRMFTEVAEVLADATVVHVTELDTLGLLAASPARSNFETKHPFNPSLLGSMMPHLKELHISLKLPLAFYGALEIASQHFRTNSTQLLHIDDSADVSTWKSLPCTLVDLPKLRRLRVWLDHTDRQTWARVNERAALQPLAPLTNNPHLDISVNLPKLHPRWEMPDRHFMEDSPAPLFLIYRRYRQREHAENSTTVVYSSDFPITHGLAEEQDPNLDPHSEARRAELLEIMEDWE